MMPCGSNNELHWSIKCRQLPLCWVTFVNGGASIATLV